VAENIVVTFHIANVNEVLQLLICIYFFIYWYFIFNRLVLLHNHPSNFYWEDELLQNLSSPTC
jgi:hypothetical protein